MIENNNLAKSDLDWNEPPRLVSVNSETQLPITRREKEVLAHIALGKTNREISQELILSQATVRNHISSIFVKLRITNRAQATSIAIRSGLVDLKLIFGNKP